MTGRIISMFSRAECNPDTPFREWYASYCRKAARADAEKAYIQMIRLGHQSDDMLRGSMAYSEMHRRLETESRYILLPASFLRGQRWEDEELLAFIPPSAEQIAEAMDKADRLMKRGKYTPK